MRKSIRIRYTVIITSILLAVLVAVTVFMNFFLEPYAAGRKEDDIIHTVDIIKNYSSDGWDNDDSFELVRESMMKNFGISLYYVNGGAAFRIFSSNTNLETVRNRLESFINYGTVEADDIVEQTEDYVLYRIYDIRMSGQQIECLGRTNDIVYVITTSMTGITDTVRMVNTFLIYVAVIGIIVAAVAAFLISGKLTKPIKKLALQSENISKLNFNTRFTGKSKDEIGTLGNNMNQMSDHLEATIRQLQSVNAQLAKDIAEKEEINKRQREFLGNVSHELKTPIALISGYAEGLRDGIADDPESTKYYTDVIVDEADKMNTIVKRLLNLDAIESGRLEPEIEEFDLIEVIKGVLNNSMQLNQEKNASVKISSVEKLNVFADEFMIEQVIQNFLSNAFHHVSDGGEIIIKAGEYTNGKVFVSVHNTGNSIPEEDLPRIWEKFFKVDKAHTRSYGGSGIGLSVVKTIMDLHGGSAFAENTENGVTFTFVLNEIKEEA